MANIRQLLVEGPRDKEVFDPIIKSHENLPSITILAYGGYDLLRSRLGVILKPGVDVERLAVIIDADTNLASGWDSISSAFKSAGYATIPKQPDAAGVVVEAEDLPRVGVWVMPNNQLPGMLEDFLSMPVPDSDPLVDYVRQALDGIPSQSRLFVEGRMIKAVIHTWLAWQKEPGTPLGLAITRKCFPIDGFLATEFVAWLNRVFA